MGEGVNLDEIHIATANDAYPGLHFAQITILSFS